MTEAKTLIERWQREYSQVRPHSLLGYRLSAPEAVMQVKGAASFMGTVQWR